MDHKPQVHIPELLNQIDGLSIPQTLQLLATRFPGQVTFSTSFSFEDQVITHDILDNNIPVSIFTLDTGRLFAETYSVWTSTNEKYSTRSRHIIPIANLLEELSE